MSSPLDRILSAGVEEGPLANILNTEPDEGERATWYQRLASGFGTGTANVAGLAAAPILDAISRPRPGSPGYDEWAERYGNMTFLERLGEAVGRAQTTAAAPGRAAGIIPERPYGGIVEDIGENIAYSIPFSAAVAGAARPLSALAGSASRPAAMVGRIAEPIAQNPVTFGIMDAAFQPGATLARELQAPYLQAAIPGTDYPITAAITRGVASLPGEMLLGSPGAWVSRHLANLTRLLPKGERFAPTRPEADPVIPITASPEAAATIARVHTVNVLDQTDRQIAHALQTAGTPGLSEVQAGANLRQGLLVARDELHQNVNRAYAALPRHITGNPRDYGNYAEALISLADEYPGEARNIPVDMLRAHVRQLAKTVDDNGQVIQWREDVPISELQRLRQGIIQDSWASAETNVLQAGQNRLLKDHLDDLSDRMTTVIEGIGAVDPRFQARFDYANALYRMSQDRFRRGPIGELLMTTRHVPLAKSGATEPPIPGTFRVPVTKVAESMVDPNETAQAIREAMDMLVQMSDRPVYAAVLRSGVFRDADQATRAVFADRVLDHFMNLQQKAKKPATAADIPTTYKLQAGPSDAAIYKAQRWMQQNEELLRSWTDTTNSIVGTIKRLTDLQDARGEHVLSLVNRFLNTNVDNVIENALRSPNSRAQFQTLYNTFRGNKDFVEGIQRALFKNLTKGDGIDPNIALQNLSQPAYRNAFEVFFQDSPDKLRRMINILEDASGVVGMAGSTRSGRLTLDKNMVLKNMPLREKLAFQPSRWLFGLGGLMLGNIVHKTLPLMGAAGALGIPARLSSGARDLLASTWIKNRVKAMNHIENAMHDPQAEALLRDAAPGNFAELRRYFLKVQRNYRRLETAVNEDVVELFRERGPALMEEDRRRSRQSIKDLEDKLPGGGQ